MGKLYIFGIGGTGSRVLRSLTMLLASGVKINASEIVPVIIDPDHAAADLTKTVSLIRDYCSIRSRLHYDATMENTFFGAKINTKIVNDFRLPIQNTQGVKFCNYIGRDAMTGTLEPNKALASMLFSDRNMNADMEVGFKGNPNMGSVVLNQFENSKIFQDVVSSFQDGDRVFVVSSIFGGTGASGFPLLVKNLRNAGANLAGSNVARKAPIGAVSVLPYFSLKPNEDSEIDSSTFISKTKAALEYYEKNLTETNVLYYIGDKITNNYDNHEGGAEQENAAHFVELASALSIIDFMSIPDDDPILQVSDGTPTAPVYKEYGINEIDDNSKLIFRDLSDQTNGIIKKPMVQFELFSKYIREQIRSSLSQTWAKNLKVDSSFLNGDFYTKIKDFCDKNHAWLEELADNHRGFAPFELNEDKSNLFKFVKGVEPKKVFSLDSNYGLYDNRLNEKQKSGEEDASQTPSKFVELFYQVTARLAAEKLLIS